MSQGSEANHSGKFLEEIVLREFMARGFVVKNHNDDGGTLDLLSQRVIVKNAPYRSIFGCRSRSEFLVTVGSRRIRVECRWQERSGSTDEKFCYLMRNAVEFMPEREILIFLGGNGARKKAIEWLKADAKRCTSKLIYVLGVDEFPRWVRDQFIRPNAEVAPLPYPSWDVMWAQKFDYPERI